MRSCRGAHGWLLWSFGVADGCLRKPSAKCAGQETTGCILTAAALGEPGPGAGAHTATALRERVWWEGGRVGWRAQGLAVRAEGADSSPPATGSAVPAPGILSHIFSGWGNRETQIK